MLRNREPKYVFSRKSFGKYRFINIHPPIGAGLGRNLRNKVRATKHKGRTLASLTQYLELIPQCIRVNQLPPHLHINPVALNMVNQAINRFLRFTGNVYRMELNEKGVNLSNLACFNQMPQHEELATLNVHLAVNFIVTGKQIGRAHV